MANKQSQQYGLIITNKNHLSMPKIGNIFGNNDDSEEEEGTDWVKKTLKAEHERNKGRKQTRLNFQKALKEDPTIFQYDEVYDQIERTKAKETEAVKKVEKKSKYIDNLLKSAELRKKEQELRKDRMIQKEIEAEDAMFPDKERFVTSSYKAKLEEMKKFEEEQKNKDRLEAIADVTKQNDMSGFYRHLYRQTVEKNKADLGIIIPEVEKVNIDRDDSIISDSESKKCESDTENKETVKISTSGKINRQYRKRPQEQSESESESEPDTKSEKQERENFPDEAVQLKSLSLAKKKKLSNENEQKIQDAEKCTADETNKQYEKKLEKTSEETILKDLKDKVLQKPKRKVNIWVKRTIGPVFEAALQRYSIRKQQRLEGS